MKAKEALQEFFVFWKVYVFIIAPIVFIPLVTEYEGTSVQKVFLLCVLYCALQVIIISERWGFTVKAYMS